MSLWLQTLETGKKKNELEGILFFSGSVTNYHRLSSLKQQIYSYTILKVKSLKSRY